MFIGMMTLALLMLWLRSWVLIRQ